MTKLNLPGHVISALNRYEEAIREDAWKGVQSPEDMEAIEDRLKLVRSRTEATIFRAIVKGTVPKNRDPRHG